MSSSVADLAALGKLLDEHRPKLLAMLERRLDPALRTRIEPEEILSEAFLAARSKWDREREKGVGNLCRNGPKGASHKDSRPLFPAMTPYAWLYRIVLDCLIEAWRRENRACRDPKREMPWPERSSVQLGLGLVNPQTSPSEAAARGELEQQMRQTLSLLSTRDQEILWMRHYDELSFGEAAAVLGVTENAATVRYVRALKRLKDLWLRLHGNTNSGG